MIILQDLYMSYSIALFIVYNNPNQKLRLESRINSKYYLYYLFLFTKIYLVNISK